MVEMQQDASVASPMLERNVTILKSVFVILFLFAFLFAVSKLFDHWCIPSGTCSVVDFYPLGLVVPKVLSYIVHVFLFIGAQGILLFVYGGLGFGLFKLFQKLRPNFRKITERFTQSLRGDDR